MFMILISSVYSSKILTTPMYYYKPKVLLLLKILFKGYYILNRKDKISSSSFKQNKTAAFQTISENKSLKNKNKNFTLFMMSFLSYYYYYYYIYIHPCPVYYIQLLLFLCRLCIIYIH